NRQALTRIIQTIGVPVQFGGGLRSIEDVKAVIELGVSRVVIGTLAVESRNTLKELVRLFGPDSIAVGIDALDGQVVTRGWEKEERLSALELAARAASLGVERVIYTDVSRDGTLRGVNIEQTVKLARESGLKVTASGGISSLEDLERLRRVSDCGIDSVIVGKALYEARFTLEEALLENRKI
ncbi:MAG TPA: HisA/HisF-related TIM barrel protein, partial [Blastocatellia bacterium]